MYHIVIQHATDKALAPKTALLRQWAKKTLSRKIKSGEITLRIVGIDEMSKLNSTYRHKNGPTNVLSFPFEVHKGVTLETPILGDIVICADIVNKEAKEQHKPEDAHWAHMIVHGILHLLGFDHENDKDAEKMEALEVEILQTLGFTNPYEGGENIKDYD